MISAEMSSSRLEQQLQTLRCVMALGWGGSKALGLHFISMDLCE